MKRRIMDMLIGQVMMAVIFILAGMAYEGVGYSDFSDYLPYIQIAVITLVMSILPSIMVFKTAIDGISYLRTLKELKNTGKIKEVEA